MLGMPGPSRSPLPWLVQKYGGTSLGKNSDKICGKIVPTALEHHNVAVVCSALSMSTKSAGTTNLLLECIDLVDSSSSLARVSEILRLIEQNHIQLLRTASRKQQSENRAEPSQLQTMEAEIRRECAEVKAVLLAAKVGPSMLRPGGLVLTYFRRLVKCPHAFGTKS
jgi:aspartate kinase